MDKIDVVPIERSSTGAISVRVYQELRRAILENELRPGQRVSENELAERLNVSRTPIREALIRLTEDGLVDVLPRHGTYVSAISVSRLFEAHALREVLEEVVARNAALRATGSDKYRLRVILENQQDAVSCGDYARFRTIDDSLHSELCQIAGMPRAWTLVTFVKTDLDRARSLVQRDPERPKVAAREHEKLIEAVEQNDSEAAVSAIHEHLSQTFAAIQGVVRRHSGLFVD